jgi:UDP-2-acetamido-3-amino-2,3-dideoxy-glucuronate N-acetyltransferase
LKPYFLSIGSSPDDRGLLEFAEYPKHLPFEPKRVFVISQVPSHAVRGQHAHATTSQLLMCVSGSMTARFTSESNENAFDLNRASGWLLVPPMNFGELSNFSSDCVLVVLASERYDPDEYISDFEEFRRRPQ